MPIIMKIEKGTAKNKKWKATFSHVVDGSLKKIKTTQFGDDRYQDYTLSRDKEQRSKYRARHKKDLETGEYMKAGYLSYYLLWGDSTSLETNIKKYKKKFNLT